MVDAKLCMKYLRKYGYKTTEQGVQKILDAWKENKAGLLEKFRQHPNWDEDSLAIVFNDVEFPKQFSAEPLNNFSSWFGRIIPKYQISKATEDKSEIYYINKLDDIRAMVRYALNNNKKVEVDGVDVTSLQEDAQKDYDDFKNRTENLHKIQEDDDKALFITNELKRDIDSVYNAIKYIRDYVRDSNINASDASQINYYYNINASEGQKLSRVINKLCTAIGLNDYKETEVNRNLEGEEVSREVGYQHQFNIMAEGVTSKTYKVHCLVSLNPIDFWGMSLMHKVASCQTIDCYNIEQRNSSYSGQYSGGTTTLMLDKNTVVFYTVIEDYRGNLYFLEDKMNRCMFSINDNGTVLIQHKNYPDGRDGGDSNKAKLYREIMQDVVSKLWNHNNLWTLKKGSSEVRPWYRKYGLHYNDLDCNSDVNVSLLKNHNDDWSVINVGVDESICPVCGRKHTYTENILCYECRNTYYNRDNAILDIFETNEDFDSASIPNYANFEIETSSSNNEDCIRCEHCGERIDEDCGICIDGNWYCDDECAENDGYHYIEEAGEYLHEDSGDISCDYETDEWHLTENGFEDDYNGIWYYAEPEVITEDGKYYYSIDNACEDGYDEDVYGNWYLREEMLWNESYGYKHHVDCIEIDGEYYWDEDDAREHGFVETIDDIWEKEDECFFDEYHDGYCRYDADEVIQIGDRYFADDDSAEDAGYVKVNDEWINKDDLYYDELTETYFTVDLAQVVTEDGNYFYCETSAIMAGYRETENGWIHSESERATA